MDEAAASIPPAHSVSAIVEFMAGFDPPTASWAPWPKLVQIMSQNRATAVRVRSGTRMRATFPLRCFAFLVSLRLVPALKTRRNACAVVSDAL